MASLNKLILIGNLTKDPEKRHTKSGQEVSTCSIAVNEKFKDSNGQMQEKVEFINLVFWRRQSEILNQYCKKGSSLYVEGKIQTTSWDDPNGVKRYRTEIVAENIIMLDRAGGGNAANNDGGNDFSQAAPNSDYSQTAPQNAPTASNQDEEEISVEDIPF